MKVLDLRVQLQNRLRNFHSEVFCGYATNPCGWNWRFSGPSQEFFDILDPVNAGLSFINYCKLSMNCLLNVNIVSTIYD